MQIRQFTRTFRLMHWAMAICFLLLLFTVFLRLTWLEKGNVAAILNEQLLAVGVTLSQEELIKIAKAIRKPMWDWHLYFGYALAGLYVLRMLLPLFGRMPLPNPLETAQNSNRKLQTWLYGLFYVFVLVSLATGLLIVFGPKSMKDTLEEAHKLALWYAVPFVVLHLGGVWLAEMGPDKGIISKMFSGDKNSRQPRQGL